MRLNKIMGNKLAGYVLLAAGVIMILLAVYGMFNVYTGGGSPPSVIELSDVKFPVPETEEVITLVSGDQASRVVNMIVWWVLMLFVASAGAKLGGMGVRLVRERIIEVRRED